MFEHRRNMDSMSKFYNWFYRFYKSIQKITCSIALDVVNDFVRPIENNHEKTALEYACGTGALTLPISKWFKSITAKDSSIGMLSNAKDRLLLEKQNVNFQVGNILDITEQENEYDWVFVSFALHLFSPENEEKIISQLLRVAREGIIIIDHKRKWNILTAIAEWLEGSYYDKYLSIDFNGIAIKNKVREYNELDRKNYFVMIMKK